MKALSIKEPWATLIVYAGKDVENRTWEMGYRGPLLVHASKAPEPLDDIGWDYLARHALRTFNPAARMPDAYRLPGFQHVRELIQPGHVIGVVDVVGCDQESGQSEWEAMGQWHIRLANARPIAQPFEWKGQLGLFSIPDPIVAHHDGGL